LVLWEDIWWSGENHKKEARRREEGEIPNQKKQEKKLGYGAKEGQPIPGGYPKKRKRKQKAAQWIVKKREGRSMKRSGTSHMGGENRKEVEHMVLK